MDCIFTEVGRRYEYFVSVSMGIAVNSGSDCGTDYIHEIHVFKKYGTEGKPHFCEGNCGFPVDSCAFGNYLQSSGKRCYYHFSGGRFRFRKRAER